MPEEFASRVRPQLEGLLEPGEALDGVVAATYQRTFSGGLYAIGVTDRRLILVPLDRRIQSKGEPLSVAPGDVASARLDGAGAGWLTVPQAILDATAGTLKLQTTGGQKVKLSMMKGGDGLLGGLGGGEAQRDGLVALASWMARLER